MMSPPAAFTPKEDRPSWMIAAVAAAVMSILAVLGVIIGLSTKRQTVSDKRIAVVQNTPAPTPEFAVRVLEFGDKGMGPGQFQDPRTVAVDGDGKIYVGESSGRVQVFNSKGKFITQWINEGKDILTKLAADRNGNLYLMYFDSIVRYDGATGKRLGVIAGNRSAPYDDVTAALDGSLYVIAENSHILQIGADGRIRKNIDVAQKTGEDTMLNRLAVDGTGQIYGFGRTVKTIFRFAPDGRYLNRFGGGGVGPGEFGDLSPEGIGVDTQGRIYVNDGNLGIKVFDGSGRYLDTFGDKNRVSAIMVDERNEIFVVESPKIIKYALSKP